MTFGEKLQMLRTRRGLSQDALAEALDVSRQAVSQWERNETLPETEKVIRLSRYFSVTTDYLLLDEVECPTANENKCTSAGLGMWVSSRGWLLGVGLVVLGVWLLLGLTRGDAPAMMRNYMDGGKSWIQAAVLLAYGVREYTTGVAALVLAGVLTIILGRRWRGSLRWYHSGWIVFFWGVCDLLVLTGLTVWYLRTIEEMWENMSRYVWFAVRDEVPFAVGTALLGLAVVLLGPRMDRPDQKADAAQEHPGSGAEP